MDKGENKYMINNYTNFILNLNENVQQAKAFLKKRALDKKRNDAQSNDKISLTPEEIIEIDNDPLFLKIKKMVSQNPGWTYLFTKIAYDYNVPINELQELYDNILSWKNNLNELPMNIIEYANLDKPHERLFDDLEKLSRSKNVREFINEFLPPQKEMWKRASEYQKEKIDEIANGFAVLGQENGVIDKIKNRDLKKLFFSKIKDDKSLQAIIDRAESYLRAYNNSNMSKFMDTISKINTKFGIYNGVDIEWNKDNIIVLWIKSYNANHILNSNTSHCIARGKSYWDDYTSNYNKQYYIYDFNLPPTSNKSVIGLTIKRDNSIRACHLKNDNGFVSSIVQYTNELNIPFSIFKGMTDQEIKELKIRIKASNDIMKANLSLDKVKELIALGADLNINILSNAINEDNIEKVEYLIDIFYLNDVEKTNLINKSRSIEMIELLLKKGFPTTLSLFNSVIRTKSIENLKMFIKYGFDPMTNNASPVFLAINNKSIDILKLLMPNIDLKWRRLLILKKAVEIGDYDIIKYLYDTWKERYPDEKIEDLTSWIEKGKNSTKIKELINSY